MQLNHYPHLNDGTLGWLDFLYQKQLLRTIGVRPGKLTNGWLVALLHQCVASLDLIFKNRLMS